MKPLEVRVGFPSQERPLLFLQADELIAQYNNLSTRHGTPKRMVMFPLLKLFAGAGDINAGQLQYINDRLGIKPAETCEVGTFYDHINPRFKTVLGDKHRPSNGEASERLFTRFLGHEGEGMQILKAGPLLRNIGPESHTLKDYKGHGGYKAFDKALRPHC